MAWALIRNSDNAWLDGPLEAEPEAGEGERTVIVALGYPETCEWSPSRGGFVDLLPAAAELISVGRFKLLFTQGERIALREAAKTEPTVEDFLDLLAGFTSGVALNDPVLVGSIEALVPAGLLSSARADAILAGSPPA
jgi:hypothetical protein